MYKKIMHYLYALVSSRKCMMEIQYKFIYRNYNKSFNTF